MKNISNAFLDRFKSNLVWNTGRHSSECCIGAYQSSHNNDTFETMRQKMHLKAIEENRKSLGHFYGGLWLSTLIFFISQNKTKGLYRHIYMFLWNYSPHFRFPHFISHEVLCSIKLLTRLPQAFLDWQRTSPQLKILMKPQIAIALTV